MVRLYESAMEGITVILWTLAMTIVLELWSIETVRNLRKHQPGGTGLHREAWISSILNPLLCAIPVYVLAAALFCVEVREGVNDTWVHSLRSILCTVVLHSCQYYAIHKAFHEHPQLYQRFHRFHHRFHTYTPPCAANAVTMGEYVLAYLIPFLLPLLVVETSTRSLQLAVIIISGCNLLVHTPPIEDWLPWKAPSWWVSTTNHQDHHRKSMKSHYASPTFNIDTLVSWYSSRRPQLHEEC